MNINKITVGNNNTSTINPREIVKPAQLATLSVSESLANKSTKSSVTVSAVALKDSVDEINRFINSSNGLNLNIDHVSGKVVVQIIDKKTNEVIRQIPSAEALSIARDLGGKKGILLNDLA